MTNPFLEPELIEVVLAFVYAESWEESRQIVEERADLLLSEDADRILLSFVAHYRSNPAMAGHIEQHRTLLRRCHEAGTEAASAELRAAAGAGSSVVQLLEEWIWMPDWEQSRAYLKRHGELLGEEAEDALAQLAAAEKQEEGRDILEHRLALLRRCREFGLMPPFPNW